jgi:hypothetical protein
MPEEATMKSFVALVRRTDGETPTDYTVNVDAADSAAAGQLAPGLATSIWGVPFELVSVEDALA